MRHLHWQHSGCCGDHEEVRIAAGNYTFQINHSGTQYRIQALNAEGGMVSHPLLPCGLAIVLPDVLQGILFKL